ncbi:hypothetical protein EI555_010531 [Monodon monoceros]|uniref:Thimet oligopeptidase n=1 Tax=Monodon monoceros TaxID=40151 RepID=A0A4U1EWX4_MONMO|nr:hypothetical protein EI555_010531 [Monodon monoceros]
MNQGEETRYHVDEYLLSESFPMQVVTCGLLGISQELLGLTFDLEEGANVWHEGVRLYTVRDAASGKVLHRQVLPGPLPLTACFSLQPVCLQQDGSHQIAIAATVAKFTKPTRPALPAAAQ